MTKRKQVHRVYVTYLPDGRYYIGYSGKPDKLYEKYYGSSSIIKEYTGQMVKETIAEYDRKSWAKMCEMLLQWQQRGDPLCLNDMINVRLRMSHLEGFHPVEWKPRVV